MWDFWIIRTRTGQPLQRVKPTSPTGSWARRLNYSSNGTDEFYVLPSEEGQEYNLNQGLRSTITAPPGSRALVVMFGGRPFYIGIIWKDSYRPRSGFLSVHHSDIWSLWDKRMAIPQNIAWNPEDPRADNFKEISVRIQGTSAATMMKRVVRWGQEGPTEDSEYIYDLPIVSPEDTPGDSEPMIANGFDFPTVTQMLSMLADRDDGPTVDFRPEIIQGPMFRWRLVTALEPEGATYLHLSAPGSPVIDVKVDRDGTEYVTDMYLAGAGSGRDISAARRFLNQEGLVDTVGVTALDRYSELARYDELAPIALAEFLRRRRTSGFTEQWEVEVDLGEPGLAHEEGDPMALEVNDLYPGRGIYLRNYNDPVLPTMDPRRFLLVGLRPAGERSVILELQPSPED